MCICVRACASFSRGLIGAGMNFFNPLDIEDSLEGKHCKILGNCMICLESWKHVDLVL